MKNQSAERVLHRWCRLRPVIESLLEAGANVREAGYPTGNELLRRPSKKTASEPLAVQPASRRRYVT
jgi:hypothetical protein